jgi:cytochrome c
MSSGSKVTEKGMLIMRAAYTDKGANGIPSATSEKILTLKSPRFPANIADKTADIRKLGFQNPRMIGSHDKAYLGYDNIDMTGIGQAVCTVFAPEERLNSAGGSIEVHIDAPDGPIIGKSKMIPVTQGKTSAPVPVDVPINFTPTPGFHDIYFVFRNENAAEDRPLFVMTTIQFHPDATAFGKKAMSMK